MTDDGTLSASDIVRLADEHALVGLVMTLTGGSANPAVVRHHLARLRQAAPCPTCNGTEWVCESHPDKPWGDALNAGPNACHCGGAGKPCPECNPLSKERRDGR